MSTEILRRPFDSGGHPFLFAQQVEQVHSDRKDRAISDIQRTVTELGTCGRPPDVGYCTTERRRFGPSAQRARQVRGWVHRIERVRWRDGGRSERRYHIVLESGRFVVSTVGSGLISDDEYATGKSVGSKSFGYVGFSGDHMHFRTASQAEQFLAELRAALGLPVLDRPH